MTKRNENRIEGPHASDEFWGPAVSVHTREQAIEDGVLVDVTRWASSGPDGMLGRFKVPVAITAALWAVIDVDRRDGEPHDDWRARVRERGESTRGRAHDVLWLARVAAARSLKADRARYPVLMTAEGRSGRFVRTRLVVEARIDGDGITIGFPSDF